MTVDDPFLSRIDDLARLILDERAREDAGDVPVLSSTRPGDVSALFERTAPEDARPWEETMEQVREHILPHLTRWQHPGFFAYFPASMSDPAILGELLSAGLGQQGMLWQTSPACTELETRVMDWLARAIGLPERFCAEPEDHQPGAPGTPVGGGVIQGTASEAVLCVIASARDRALRALPEDKRWRTRVAVYASEQTHSSIEKACRVLGPQVVHRPVPTDGALATDPGVLERMIDEDARTDDILPACVVATLGTTATTAVDPIDAIGRIAEKHDVWAHVDAAFMGAQLLIPEERAHNVGVERYHSFSFNPHKWLLTNFDCSALWLAPSGRRDLVDTMSITPEYLRNDASDAGAVIDYRDWHVPLGRRFRALKLWMVMRHYGVAGLRAHVAKHLAWARELASWIDDDPRFDLACAPVSSLVCFSHTDGDDASRALLERVNATGDVFLTHCVVPVRGTPRYLIRVAIGGTRTERAHVERLWALINEAADASG